MPEKSLSFSIIIPTYNRPNDLKASLSAISELSYPRELFEVIVVDDGSEDVVALTQVIKASLAKLDVTMIRQNNAGPSVARNTGASQAKKNFLVFIDDDCLPSEDWLSSLANCFSLHPEAVIGGRTMNALAHNRYAIVSQMIVDMVYDHYNRDPQKAQFFAACNMAFPYFVFKKVGGFDPAFRTSEDRELCDRLLFQNHQLIYAPEVVISHREAVNFYGFCERHFGYGRGAYRFHQIRSLRGSGKLKEQVKFHSSLNNWLFYPFRQAKGINAVLMMFLLLLWQLVNAAGFFWEALVGKRGKGQTLNRHG